MVMPDPRLTDAILQRIAAALPDAKRPLVVGISGAQGSGKSTLAAHLAEQLGQRGIRTAAFSLDDLYLTRAERQHLGRDVHPLCVTRGVPGTHDVGLGLATLAALDRGEAVALPRFDKATDDRAPRSAWPCAPARTEVVLFDGWCVGARPQPDVGHPINTLEAQEDADGHWRAYSNAALGRDYQDLFARIDLLILLAAPGWEAVAGWREQQEAELRLRGGPSVMSPAEVARFIQHYERLTRWILEEMPHRADLTLQLGPNREVLGL